MPYITPLTRIPEYVQNCILFTNSRKELLYKLEGAVGEVAGWAKNEEEKWICSEVHTVRESKYNEQSKYIFTIPNERYLVKGVISSVTAHQWVLNKWSKKGSGRSVLQFIRITFIVLINCISIGTASGTFRASKAIGYPWFLLWQEHVWAEWKS